MKRTIIRSLSVALISVGLLAGSASVVAATPYKKALAAYELQLKTYRDEVQSINLTFEYAIQTATTNYRIALKATPSTQKTVVAAAEARYKIALEQATTPAEKTAARTALAEAVAAAWQNYGNTLAANDTAAASAALSAFNSAVTAAVLAQQNAITALGPKPVPPTK